MSCVTNSKNWGLLFGWRQSKWLCNVSCNDELKLTFSNFKTIQNFESWMHEDNDDDDEEYICRICPLLLAPSRKTTQAPWRCSPTLPQPPSPNHTMTTAGIGILTEFATDILLYWVPILFSFIIFSFLFLSNTGTHEMEIKLDFIWCVDNGMRLFRFCNLVFLASVGLFSCKISEIFNLISQTVSV